MRNDSKYRLNLSLVQKITVFDRFFLMPNSKTKKTLTRAGADGYCAILYIYTYVYIICNCFFGEGNFNIETIFGYDVTCSLKVQHCFSTVFAVW